MDQEEKHYQLMASTVPCNDELRMMVSRVATWPDLIGVDVPIKNGTPLLGDELKNWINEHRHYHSDVQDVNSGMAASMGFAFMLMFAEMERGFIWELH